MPSWYPLKCPVCSQTDSFDVVVSTWAELHEDGTEVYGDHEWDDESTCKCGDCGYIGVVGEFTVDEDEDDIEDNNKMETDDLY